MSSGSSLLDKYIIAKLAPSATPLLRLVLRRPEYGNLMKLNLALRLNRHLAEKP